MSELAVRDAIRQVHAEESAKGVFDIGIIAERVRDEFPEAVRLAFGQSAKHFLIGLIKEMLFRKRPEAEEDQDEFDFGFAETIALGENKAVALVDATLPELRQSLALKVKNQTHINGNVRRAKAFVKEIEELTNGDEYMTVGQALKKKAA